MRIAKHRSVTVIEGAAIVSHPPQDCVVLDVRTQGEFDAAHLNSAVTATC